MIRRKFIGLMTLTGAGSFAALSAKGLADRKTMSCVVHGFTCITCATGLETLLQREKGVLNVRANYPEGLTTVTYNAKVISQPDILSAIEIMGFRAVIDSAGAGNS